MLARPFFVCGFSLWVLCGAVSGFGRLFPGRRSGFVLRPLVFAAGAADVQLLIANPDFLQVIENVFWHSQRQIDEAVVVPDIDMADVFGIDTRFVSDGSDNVARLHFMIVSYLDAETFHALGRCGSVSGSG